LKTICINKEKTEGTEKPIYSGSCLSGRLIAAFSLLKGNLRETFFCTALNCLVNF